MRVGTLQPSLRIRQSAAGACSSRNRGRGSGLWSVPERRSPDGSRSNWLEGPAQNCFGSRLIQPDPTKSDHEGNAKCRMSSGERGRRRKPKAWGKFGLIQPGPTKSDLIQPVKEMANVECRVASEEPRPTPSRLRGRIRWNPRQSNQIRPNPTKRNYEGWIMKYEGEQKARRRPAFNHQPSTPQPSTLLQPNWSEIPAQKWLCSKMIQANPTWSNQIPRPIGP